MVKSKGWVGSGLQDFLDLIGAGLGGHETRIWTRAC